MHMIERMAYWIVVIQMPIYIAQKDIPGGLHWEHSTKGIIYFWWALTQNLIPIFAGGFADKYGRKNILLLSFILSILGFILLGTQREFIPFLSGALVLGLGLGLFKPALQGAIAAGLNDRISNAGWSINIMLINLSVFFGSYISKMLRGISWEAVFFGSAAIFALNFIFIFFIEGNRSSGVVARENHGIPLFKKMFANLLKPNVALFIMLMSGFTMIYMQFYETLPNFIFDWVDTGIIVDAFNVPAAFTVETVRGTMLSYETLFSINSFLIIFFIVPVSWIFADKKITMTILFGIILSTAGLMFAGASTIGYFTIAGIMIYTFGEMITNPRFTEYMSRIAPVEDKSLYMGYMSISWAIGLAGGGLLGGELYKNLGEKSGFAMKYLSEKFPDITGITHNNAVQMLQEKTGLSASEATSLLWNVYDPWHLWLPFVVIAIVSIIGLYFYSKRHDK